MQQDPNAIQVPDRKEGIEKMKNIVQNNPVCFFVTHLLEVPMQTRPMFTLNVCDEGNFWFLSHAESTLNEDLEIDAQVQLLFGNTPDSQFLTVYGKASISRDRQKIAEIWDPKANAWFPDGRHSPGITVIKVTPDTAHYWDAPAANMISLIKSTATRTSKTNEEGVQTKPNKNRLEIGLNFAL